jgi:transcriptional antiterminator RfaH
MRSILQTPDNSSWYVVYTHRKQEERAHSNLRSGGIETFSPKLKDYRYNRITGAKTQVVKHLFPRYIFARFRVDNSLHQVRYTRGVHSVVSFGDQPTPVAEDIISVLKSRVGTDGYVNVGEELQAGDEVMIKDGPLKNLVGTFERQMKEVDRVMILLKTVSYQARLIVEKGIVSKVK